MNQIEYQHAKILYEMDKIRELDEFCDYWEEIDGADDPFVLVNRAKVLFKKGHVEEAVSMLKDVIRDEVEEYAYIPLIEIMVHGGTPTRPSGCARRHIRTLRPPHP